MQQAFMLPVVLRAVATARQWLTKENKFASSIVEERVSNLQVVALIDIMAGISNMFAVGNSVVMPLMGVVMMAIGIHYIKED